MTAHFETYPQQRHRPLGPAGLDLVEGYGWRLVAGNGEKIAGGEGHRDRTDAERAARTVMANVLEVWQNDQLSPGQRSALQTITVQEAQS